MSNRRGFLATIVGAISAVAAIPLARSMRAEPAPPPRVEPESLEGRHVYYNPSAHEYSYWDGLQWQPGIKVKHVEPYYVGYSDDKLVIRRKPITREEAQRMFNEDLSQTLRQINASSMHHVRHSSLLR